MKRLLSAALVSGAFALAPLSAGAATFLGSSLTNGLSTQALVDSGVTATFNAYSNAGSNAPGNFEKKTISGYTAVGVQGGRTGGELDINANGVSEEILVNFSSALRIGTIEIAFLFDGPEFGDFNEVAVIEGSNGMIGELIATYTNANGLVAFWDVITDAAPAVAVGNLSPATGSGAAVWRITDPFGTLAAMSSLSFTARNGVCGIAPCDNQSDYSLHLISGLEPPAEIPEPGTYALMLAGLGMLGLMIRRRASA